MNDFFLKIIAANHEMDIDFGEYSTVTTVDIDGDGDLDLFVSNYEQEIYFMENVGTKDRPSFSSTKTLESFGISATCYGSCSGSNTHQNPIFADMDNDGKSRFHGLSMLPALSFHFSSSLHLVCSHMSFNHFSTAPPTLPLPPSSR